MSRRWVFVGVIVVAVLCLGGYALARPSSGPKAAGWFSYPPLTVTTHTTAPSRSHPRGLLRRGGAPSGRCPAGARPLPAAGVAYAAQAALAQAPQDYPGRSYRDAQVVAADRSAFAGPRGQQVARQCGRAVARRTVVVQLLFVHLLPSASLSQGVVFVSHVSRGYRAWEIAH